MNTTELKEATKLVEEYHRLQITVDKLQEVERSLDLAVRAISRDRDLDISDSYFWGLPPEVFERICRYLLGEHREKLQALGVTGL